MRGMHVHFADLYCISLYTTHKPLPSIRETNAYSCYLQSSVKTASNLHHSIMHIVANIAQD